MTTAFQEKKWEGQKPGAPQRAPYQGMDPRAFAFKKPEEQTPGQIEEIRYQALSEQASTAIQALRDASLKWQEADRARLEALPQELTETVLKLTQQIIECEVRTNPDIILKATRALLEESAKAAERTLHLHPEDAAFLKAEKSQDWAEIENLPGVSVVESSSLTRGTCRLEMAHTIAEASLSKRIEFLWSELMGAKSEAGA